MEYILFSETRTHAGREQGCAGKREGQNSGQWFLLRLEREEGGGETQGAGGESRCFITHTCTHAHMHTHMHMCTPMLTRMCTDACTYCTCARACTHMHEHMIAHRQNADKACIIYQGLSFYSQYFLCACHIYDLKH